MPNGPPPGPQPYLVYGTVRDNAGNLANAIVVTAKNLTTAETQNTTTNASGEYSFDCLNFASQYTNGDNIQCSCVYDNGIIVIDNINLFGSELLLGGASAGMAIGTPTWSYGKSVISHDEPDWSYGESYHYLEPPIEAVPASSSVAKKLIATGLL